MVAQESSVSSLNNSGLKLIPRMKTAENAGKILDEKISGVKSGYLWLTTDSGSQVFIYLLLSSCHSFFYPLTIISP